MGARRPAGAHDAGADVGNFRRLETGIEDRLLHRDVVPRRAFAKETHCTAVDHVSRIQGRRALHLRTETKPAYFSRG